MINRLLNSCSLSRLPLVAILLAVVSCRPALQPPAVLLATPVPLPSATPGVEESEASRTPYVFPFSRVDDFDKDKSGKVSGIVFYPPRQTLFTVRDNGRITEIGADGTLIRQKELREDADFEGVAYSPDTERLYVAVEGEELILEVDPDSLAVERDIAIDRLFDGTVLFAPEGDGIEGITFVPADVATGDGTFYLVNQSDRLDGPDPSIVFEVEVDTAASEPTARIVRYFSVGVTDLSGIHYVPENQQLLIISDANDLLLVVSLSGQILETHILPGENQEAITLDAAGRLYIGQDTKKEILQYRPIDFRKSDR